MCIAILGASPSIEGKFDLFRPYGTAADLDVQRSAHLSDGGLDQRETNLGA
jgi:hypothetical protein